MPSTSPTKWTIFLRHESGALHEYGDKRAAKLARESLAGRGTPEITTLLCSGYVGFLDDAGPGDRPDQDT